MVFCDKDLGHSYLISRSDSEKEQEQSCKLSPYVQTAAMFSGVDLGLPDAECAKHT